MKILYHHRTLSRDGQDVHITELIAAFRRAGHDVRIVSPAEHDQSEFGSEGGFLSALRARLPKLITELLELVYSFVAYRQLSAAAQEFEPDFIYERYNVFTVPGVWLKRRFKLPYLVEVNSPLAEERELHDGLFWTGLARWSEQYVWRAGDAVLPVTQVLAGHVHAAGVPPERVTVIPNGIDPAKFSEDLDDGPIRAKYSLGTRTVVGFTGFLRDWHGLPSVVDVLADLASEADVHFLIVGDGPARQDVEDRARARNFSDRLTITGLVQRSDVAEHQAAFDIAIQPQATAYASPLKLFEYMALGHAIIAPDQPNLTEVLTHDSNALLFDPNDPVDMKKAIGLLVQDESLRKRLGKAAAQTVRDTPYTWDGNADRVIALAAQALEASNPKET